MINTSFVAFGRVITALVDKSVYISYWDSKFMRLLCDVLGGKLCMCIIVIVFLVLYLVEEMLSMFEYAYWAKNIKNFFVVNGKKSKSDFLNEM